MSPAPSPILEDWIDRLPRGRALDLGAGEGDAARWLARRGYRVDAVERDPVAFAQLTQRTSDLPLRAHKVDLLAFPLPPSTYSLILADAVLHFLRPSDLWPLADRLAAALAPGGYLAAEVFTSDDPSLEERRAAGEREIEPNTFLSSASDAGVVHYFAPGELRRVFAPLEVVFYEESRRAAPDSDAGYRAGASLLARCPPAANEAGG